MSVQIEQVFRVTVHIDCWEEGEYYNSTLSDEAEERALDLEDLFKDYAKEFGVDFESLNTQVLWNLAIRLECSEKEPLEKMIAKMFEMIEKTEHVKVKG